jgi:hypothetical protein
VHLGDGGVREDLVLDVDGAAGDGGWVIEGFTFSMKRVRVAAALRAGRIQLLLFFGGVVG